MSPAEISEHVEQFVKEYISSWEDYFIVEVIVKRGSNKITVLLDADHGVNIDKCAELNRALHKHTEEDQLFGTEDFAIEVSSAGIDRPLTLLRQYKKNIGRNVKIILNDQSIKEGKLVSADEQGVDIEKSQKKKNKNDKKEVINFPFTEIRQVKVLVSF